MRAAYPLRLLGHFVRERQDFPIEFAIWRLTGHPAEVFGLTDRGQVRTGAFAGLCVFDPVTVHERPVEVGL